MSCVLGQHDEMGRKERAIYYLSKKFNDYKTRYTVLEKTCCAFTWASQRLRHYMLNYTTMLIARMDLLKYLFEKPTLTGRIARWQMLLSEFDIVSLKSNIFKLVKTHPLFQSEWISLSFFETNLTGLRSWKNWALIGLRDRLHGINCDRISSFEV